MANNFRIPRLKLFFVSILFIKHFCSAQFYILKERFLNYVVVM